MGNQAQSLFDNLSFLKIFKTFRMAIQPTKLIIAFLALAFICLSGWLMDLSKTVVATPGTQGKITELHIYVISPERVNSYINSTVKAEYRGVFSTLWHFTAAKFNNAVNSLFVLNIAEVKANISDYCKAIAWALKYHTFYCIIFFLIILSAISFAGGAICRIAALQCASDEKPGLAEATRFGAKKFPSLIFTPLLPLCLILILGIFIMLLGLFCNIPWAGEIATAFLMPLALTAGGCIAALLIAAVVAFGLMYPTIAYEGTDSLDAMGRCFNYVFIRPWRLIFYTLVAAVYGAICYTFARFFTFLLLWSTHWFLGLAVFKQNSSNQINKLEAIWPEPSFMNLPGSAYSISNNWSEWLAAQIIGLFLLAIIGLLVSFIMSFYFSANTIIYSLIRNKVDNTAYEDIHVRQNNSKLNNR